MGAPARLSVAAAADLVAAAVALVLVKSLEGLHSTVKVERSLER